MISEYTQQTTIQDRRLGHEIRVDIDVKTGHAEESKEKAGTIEDAVHKALKELE